MSGNKFVLDTNAVIYLLKGTKELSHKISGADWIGISVITYIEFLSFDNLSKNDRNLFDEFLKRVNIENISMDNEDMILETTKIRKDYSVKLPDAIIVSTALNNDATLITWDKKLNDLEIIQTYPDSI